MRDTLLVYLHGDVLGEVIRLDDGRIIFDFDEGYIRDPNRRTLSQSLIREDGGVQRGTPASAAGLIPPFFSNLLPEGQLRSYLAKLAGVSEQRELELLELLGEDLPGAVTVHHVRSGGSHLQSNQFDEDPASRPLRFSLAGVQLKFSAVERAAGGLTIPAQGIGGDWIVKLPSIHYQRIAENEYSVMSMASRVGLEIPEIRLVPMIEIDGLPPEVIDLPESDALVIRRFDRVAGRRIHMEDFAQATGERPADKYTPRLNYTDLTRLVAMVCDEEDVVDFSRRLMFNVIIGNGDMHLKNWSFIYPDARTPKLSPAYDFLCTSIYIQNESAALKLGSTKNWRDLTLDDFADVAFGAGVDRQNFVSAAIDTVVRFHDCWDECVKSLPIDDQLKQGIEHQMMTCPAIKSALR